MIMKYLTILLIALLSLASSCQKEDPFPPEDYHKDIFRFGCDAVDCQYYWKDTKTFEISAVNKSFDGNENQSIGIASVFAALGDNELGLSLREYKDWNKPGNCGFYDLDTTSTRRLTILEVDTINYLIEGTFEFTAIDHYEDCKDTIHITDGYFHVNFRF